MIKKLKNISLSLGMISVVTIPVISIISCGNDVSNNKERGEISNPNSNNGRMSIIDNSLKSVTDSKMKKMEPANFISDWKPLDRSGKVLSIDSNVDWNVEASGNNSTIIADVYHTALFDYVVEKGAAFNGVKYDKKIIEGLAKIFEKNTIIGAGHYSNEIIGENKSISKNFPIQFLKSDSPCSFGGFIGVSMECSPALIKEKKFWSIQAKRLSFNGSTYYAWVWPSWNHVWIISFFWIKRKTRINSSA